MPMSWATIVLAGFLVREIYPLATSDSRSSNYATLGQNNTWIKLATPPLRLSGRRSLGTVPASASRSRSFLRSSSAALT